MNNIFPIKELQEQLKYLKENNINEPFVFKKTVGKIKSLTQCMFEFLQTEKGKEMLRDYMIEQNAFDQDLLNEIKNYNNG